MGEIIEIAAVGLELRAPVVVVVRSTGPDSRNARAALVSCGAGAAAAASPAAGGSKDILDRKILFVDIVAFSDGRDLLVIVETVEIETFIIVLVGADACNSPAKIAH